MKDIKAIIGLIIATMLCALNVGVAQNNGANQQYSPKQVLKFLDKNNDGKISQKEATRAKRLVNNFASLDTNSDGYLTLEELENYGSSSRYTYLENDGVFIYYETAGEALYRELLPEEFDMPDRLLVYTFISDFYKMDAETQPYKEMAIFLLGKYKGEEMWHCVYMPVTSKESMLVGRHRLGLPKTIGDIDCVRSDSGYTATSIDENKHKVLLSVDTNNHTLGKEQKELLKKLSTLPKMNILNGEVIEMSGGRKGNVFDLAETFPSRMTLKSGVGMVKFDKSTQKDSNNASPLDLEPTKILGAYYMLNTIPFRLGKK